MMMRRLMLSMLLAVTTAAAAEAQPRPQPARNQSISAAAQWALPYPGDGSAPGVLVSWRRWLTPYVGIGTDARWWQRDSVTEFNSPAQEGPGAIRRFQGLDERKTVSVAFSVGALARGSIGRLSLVGGAGPGFYVDRASYESRINERHESRTDLRRSLGVHVLGELEVRLTTRLSGFADCASNFVTCAILRVPAVIPPLASVSRFDH